MESEGRAAARTADKINPPHGKMHPSRGARGILPKE